MINGQLSVSWSLVKGKKKITGGKGHLGEKFSFMSVRRAVQQGEGPKEKKRKKKSKQ